jgi:hypothetical protein
MENVNAAVLKVLQFVYRARKLSEIILCRKGEICKDISATEKGDSINYWCA